MKATRGLLAAILVLPLGLCALGAVGGTGLLVWAARDVQRTRSQRASAVRATGTIVSLRAVLDSGEGPPSTVYFATVEFRTPDQAAHRFESHLGILSGQGRVGDTVPVLYAPGQPDHADTQAAWDERPLAQLGVMGIAGTIVAAALGTAALLVAAWWYARSRTPA